MTAFIMDGRLVVRIMQDGLMLIGGLRSGRSAKVQMPGADKTLDWPTLYHRYVHPIVCADSCRIRVKFDPERLPA
jgi:hypothetical protein